jgi:exonuclease III
MSIEKGKGKAMGTNNDCPPETEDRKTTNNLTINQKSNTKNQETQTLETGLTIQIATANTRGLCKDGNRMNWTKLWHTNNWDIVISTETNGNDCTSKFWKAEDYECHWSNTEQKQGTGIGIALKKELAARIINKDVIAGRAIKLDLAFPHKKYLRIIGIYSPANPTDRPKLEKQTIHWLSNSHKTNWETIVAGDFNDTDIPSMDKYSNKHHRFENKVSSHSILINNLKEHTFINTFRVTNPQKQEYTWERNVTSASRIDQI